MKKAQMKDNEKMIITLFKNTKRKGIDKLIAGLALTDFYEAPASTRLDYHGCEKGGLAEHSLNVYNLFEDKVKRYNLDIKPEEITIASLCHDFCKIGLYKPNRLKSGSISKTKPYVVDDLFPFGHGEKSVAFVNKYISLTKNESLLIRWHMGNFDSEWENYEDKVAKSCPAIYAFQYADQEASKYLDLKIIR